MKYLKTYSTSAEYTSDKDNRQGRLWPVVSLTGGTTVNIDEDDILNKIPDGYEKCRYIYNTANLNSNATFGFATASTVNDLLWVVKCSWQENYFENNTGTGTETQSKYQYIGNGQSARVFGINMNSGYSMIWVDGGLNIDEAFYPSSNPNSPQIIKYSTKKYTSGTLEGKFYVQMDVNDIRSMRYGTYNTNGTTSSFIGKTNYLFGGHPFYPVWAYIRHLAIYEDNILVHNLLSCKRKSDNQYGLYDTVDGTWHGHASLSGVLINTNDRGTATQFNPLEPIEGGDIRPL